MNEKIIVDISEIILATVAISGIAIILVATWHDMRAIAHRTRLRAIASNLSKIKQPFVTVLIYAHNNASIINDCLDRITANDYERYKIVVVNNASTDRTVQLASAYKKSHPEVLVSIYSREEPVNRLVALREACGTTQKNELILILNATDGVNPYLLKEVAARFILNEKISLLQLRTSAAFDHHFYTLPTQFIRLTRNIVFKALFAHIVVKNISYDPPVVIHSSIFTSETLPARLVTSYASDILITTRIDKPIHTKTGAVKTITTITIALLLISIMSYFFYTAATLQSSTMLTLSWLLTILWLISITWSDEAMTYKNRLVLLITIPFMYFVFYVSLITYLYKAIWLSVSAIPSPMVSTGNIRHAIQVELYSTRY